MEREKNIEIHLIRKTKTNEEKIKEKIKREHIIKEIKKVKDYLTTDEDNLLSAFLGWIADSRGKYGIVDMDGNIVIRLNKLGEAVKEYIDLAMKMNSDFLIASSLPVLELLLILQPYREEGWQLAKVVYDLEGRKHESGRG